MRPSWPQDDSGKASATVLLPLPSPLREKTPRQRPPHHHRQNLRRPPALQALCHLQTISPQSSRPGRARAPPCKHTTRKRLANACYGARAGKLTSTSDSGSRGPSASAKTSGSPAPRAARARRVQVPGPPSPLARLETPTLRLPLAWVPQQTSDHERAAALRARAHGRRRRRRWRRRQQQQHDHVCHVPTLQRCSGPRRVRGSWKEWRLSTRTLPSWQLEGVAAADKDAPLSYSHSRPLLTTYEGKRQCPCPCTCTCPCPRPCPCACRQNAGRLMRAAAQERARPPLPKSAPGRVELAPYFYQTGPVQVLDVPPTSKNRSGLDVSVSVCREVRFINRGWESEKGLRTQGSVDACIGRSEVSPDRRDTPRLMETPLLLFVTTNF